MPLNDQDRARSDSLGQAAAARRKLGEHALTEAIFRCVFRSSAEGVEFANWLLLLCGATLGLVLSNLADIAPLYSPSVLRGGLLLLTFSAIFGSAVKYLAWKAGREVRTTELIESALARVFKQHEEETKTLAKLAEASQQELPLELDFQAAFQPIVKATWRFWRRGVRRSLKRPEGERWSRHEYFAQLAQWQAVAMFVQIILAASGFLLLGIAWTLP